MNDVVGAFQYFPGGRLVRPGGLRPPGYYGGHAVVDTRGYLDLLPRGGRDQCLRAMTRKTIRRTDMDMQTVFVVRTAAGEPRVFSSEAAAEVFLGLAGEPENQVFECRVSDTVQDLADSIGTGDVERRLRHYPGLR